MKFFAGMAATVAVTALTVSSCSNTGNDTASGASGDSKGPLKIGVIVPLSGASGPNGKEVLNAIQVESAAWNKAGGVDGRKIEVISADDKSTPADGVTAANQLASKHVDVVMGGWNSRSDCEGQGRRRSCPFFVQARTRGGNQLAFSRLASRPANPGPSPSRGKGANVQFARAF